MSRDGLATESSSSDGFEPATPPGQNSSAYTQLPPSSPFSPSDQAFAESRPIPPRFVSSPLNPHASAALSSSAHSSTGLRTRPTSWGSSNMGDHSSVDRHAPESTEKDQVRGIMAGNVGGTFSPYPTLVRPFSSRDSRSPSRTQTLNSMAPPSSHRFSAASSVGSVLSFMTDSKYATSNSGFLPGLFKTDADPRASSFLPADSFGPYERLGGPADDDDFIHEPEAKNMKVRGSSWRGFVNIGVIVLILLALVTLFAGYPIISHYTRKIPWKNARVNATGQIPDLFQLPSLIDPKTPQDQLTRTGLDGEQYELVFSDEFETPDRTFYPGDDPFWEAVDLHYWATGDMEWYDPGQVTTRDGKLVIVVEDTPNHDLQFKSGMLQTWNKFCFTSGYIEVSVVFPSQSDVSGYWPGAWIMGNLGRPGYGATTDGLWPYSYDACDVGTLANQTLNGEPAAAATAGGSAKYNNNISWQPGQRLSACTCPNEDHPGPDLNKPSGRASPEIDIFEAQKNKEGYGGRVTQSVQMAPFSTLYYFPNTTADVTINHPERTKLNSYRGSALQQAISALTDLNDTTFALGGGEFTKFGIEYWADPSNRKDGFINWVADDPVFRIDANTFSGDTALNISDRLIPEEPMAIVLNLAISESFQKVDLAAMTFPAEFLIDYVRVWQRKGLKNGVGCDPPNYPTAKYINDHIDVYTNPNYTTWIGAGKKWPKNSMKDGC